jgi:hypothetical protein
VSIPLLFVAHATVVNETRQFHSGATEGAMILIASFHEQLKDITTSYPMVSTKGAMTTTVEHTSRLARVIGDAHCSFG